MPKKTELKCYFGCVIDGPLHKFPNPQSMVQWEHYNAQIERYNKWKAVLDLNAKEKGDSYIYNSLRLCNRHFEEYFKLPSGKLTKNAIPTLNIAQSYAPGDQSFNHPEANLLEQPSTSAAAIAQSHEPAEGQPVNQLLQPSTSAAMIGPSTSTDKHQIRKPQPTTKYSKGATHVMGSYMYQKTIAQLTTKLERLNKKFKLQNNKIRAAKNLSLNKSFLSLIDKLPKNIKCFTKLQLKWAKKPRGRRFTTEEKIMCLTILKQSPKAYSLLRQMFVMPSKRCLQKILSAYVVIPGVNKEIVEELKEVARKMPEEKKIVNLLFDEVSLAPGLYYNSARDEISGFEDYGFKKTKSLADHALVFMIKGIKSKTKQPICFTFCKSSTKKEDLKRLIINIIKDLHECGLKVIATICDQASTNVSTIKSLQEDTKISYLRKGEEYNSKAFEIDGKKVFPLFDPPHLLKGVRNNLLTKNATFMQNGQAKCAKWAHIEMLLNIDEGSDDIRLVNKLTEYHVKKDKIPKMKVKYAAQVFSQRVSSALRFLAKHNILPAECEQTGDFLLIFDKLFDSFNGHSYEGDAKMFKCCLKNNSPHFQLWNDLLPILESIQFQSVGRNGLIRHEMIPSIKNWVHNIRTFREMWEHLNKIHNVYNLLTRNFNQDPLENFFSSIRSNGVRNINPTCNQFISAFKTLIINNFSSPHSARANCEKDQNNSMQSLLNVLQRNCDDSRADDFACDIDSIINIMTKIKTNESLLHVESKKYVTGYVIKKCKTKIFKKCKVCMNDFCRSEVDLESFNWEIDYTKKSLLHPSDGFVNLMNDIYFMIAACLRDFPQSLLLKRQIINVLNCACDYNIISCKKHKIELINLINNLAANLIINSWCTGVNRILNGKICKFDKNDHIKNQAYEYCNKRKK